MPASEYDWLHEHIKDIPPLKSIVMTDHHHNAQSVHVPTQPASSSSNRPVQTRHKPSQDRIDAPAYPTFLKLNIDKLRREMTKTPSVTTLRPSSSAHFELNRPTGDPASRGPGRPQVALNDPWRLRYIHDGSVIHSSEHFEHINLDPELPQWQKQGKFSLSEVHQVSREIAKTMPDDVIKREFFRSLDRADKRLTPDHARGILHGDQRAIAKIPSLTASAIELKKGGQLIPKKPERYPNPQYWSKNPRLDRKVRQKITTTLRDHSPIPPKLLYQRLQFHPLSAKESHDLLSGDPEVQRATAERYNSQFDSRQSRPRKGVRARFHS